MVVRQKEDEALPSLLQSRHLRRKDQGHATASRIAVEDCGTMKVVLERALFIGGAIRIFLASTPPG